MLIFFLKRPSFAKKELSLHLAKTIMLCIKAMAETRESIFRQANEVLESYDTISLEEMSAVKLMNRIDTKFVIPLVQLKPLLLTAASQYFVQAINDKCTAAYHTIYLDTDDHRMYNMHQTGRKVRQKIRVRTYEETGITFLEIKNKNNHGRTKKKRIEVPTFESVFQSDEASQFLEQKAWYTIDQLRPHVENYFDRITLINHGMTERLTIDLGLRFHNFDIDTRADIGHCVVIELKRDGLTHSPMQDIFLDMRILPGGFSKYCIGSAFTNPSLRHNNLKEKMHRVERFKLMQEGLLID